MTRRSRRGRSCRRAATSPRSRRRGTCRSPGQSAGWTNMYHIVSVAFNCSVYFIGMLLLLLLFNGECDVYRQLPQPLRSKSITCFAAGSAKRRMDSSSGRSKVGVSSEARVAHQARQRTRTRHADILLWPSVPGGADKQSAHHDTGSILYL